MDKPHKDSSVTVLNVISKLVQDIEKKFSGGNTKIKECSELNLLKEKCCDGNACVSVTAFHGILSLVQRGVLTRLQTISTLVSILPSVNQYGPLVSTIGDILTLDLQNQLSEKGTYDCPYSSVLQHPFIMILKYNKEKSWCDINTFVLQFLESKADIKHEHKIKFLRPIFRHVFWGSLWKGSQFQLKLFDTLLLWMDQKEFVYFALEVLMWEEMDIHYCLFLQDLLTELLKKKPPDGHLIVAALTPTLAVAIKWLIISGHNPTVWISLLKSSLEIDVAASSSVLYILTDVIMETPSMHVNSVVDVCRTIIYSTSCCKYVAYKFMAVILNWFITPSSLVNPLYKTLEEIMKFINTGPGKWNDQTTRLTDNPYFRLFGSNNRDVKFAIDLILVTGDHQPILSWLRNLKDSNENGMMLKLHSFVYGIMLGETDRVIIDLCLDLLFRLTDCHKEIAFSCLCLLFYKLGREVDPTMQKLYLFSLPKLAVKKENIPLIVNVIESLKKGRPKMLTPLVIQLYLSLWKFDNRTYSYLHQILHDTTPDFDWELNISKAIALREICRRAPHLHAKDLVGVLSKILNVNSGQGSGLPAAIAIEAVTELCKAYVIDVTGTWNAIQPKLKVDNRPKVKVGLCRFFGEIPNLDSPGQKHEKLTREVVPMLWKYSFEKDTEVVTAAFRALSSFSIENLELSLFPEVYRENVKMPKDLEKNSKNPEDILALPYVPAECWVQFLQKINQGVLRQGGDLVAVILERELNSLPRGLFYLPQDKCEPLSYSYLPQRSLCRSLVDCLQREARENAEGVSPHAKEVIRVISREYSKLLPPLNWSFLEKFMSSDPGCLRLCLAVLAKQGSSSESAKALLDKHLKSVQWDSDQLEQVLLLCGFLPSICKALHYDALKNFLENTIELCLRAALNSGSGHFNRILENLTEALRNKSLQSGHKNLIAKQLERVLEKIPPESEAMKAYALCATEFSVKTIERLTSVKEPHEVDSEWFRRAVAIRCAIAMRPDIKNPLAWLNEFMEAAATFPREQPFILRTIWSIIRSRRDCNHGTWLQELTWRIPASITSSGGDESNKVALFLVEVFLSTIVVLSGHDCLFAGVTDFTADRQKKLDLFPQSLSVLLSSPDWMDLLPKVSGWLQKLSKWNHLPRDMVAAISQALLSLRTAESFADDTALAYLFNSYSLPE